MKSIKKITLLVALALFGLNSNAFAQKLSDSKTGEIKKEQEKIKQDKEKVKDEMKQKKDEMKEKKDQMKDDMKEAKKGVKQDAEAYSDLKSDKITMLEEKLKKARTEKERKEIMDMIATAKKGQKSDGSSTATDTDGSAAGEDSDAKQTSATATGTSTGNDNNDYDEKEGKGDALKGKDAGMARVTDAKAKLARKEADLASKEDLVRNGRARIAAAQERLDVAIAAGNLSEDDIAIKQAQIDRATVGIDKLEASINAGKASYAKQKATLSKVYDQN